MTKYAIVFDDRNTINQTARAGYDLVRQAATTYANLSRTARAQVESTFDQSVANGAHVETAVRAYESAYRTAGKDHAKLVAAMRNALVGSGCALIIVGQNGSAIMSLAVSPPPPANRNWSQLATPTQPANQPPPVRHRIGTIAVGLARFAQIAAPQHSDHPHLLRHVETGVQYVLDRNNRPVRRFVKRAINDYDVTHMNDAEDLRAATFSTQKTKKEREEYPNLPMTPENRVLFHLQKGSNRFNSTSTTKHKVFSNTGVDFITPGNGYILVDLVYVPQNTIQDVHTEDAIKSAIGASGADFGQAFTPQRNYEPHQRAIRDAVRTREVLIDGWIPYTAIAYYSRTNEWLNGADSYDQESRACITRQFPGLVPPQAGH